jgi:hypothetical protein
MVALDDNYELRTLVNLWSSSKVFPMWYQVIQAELNKYVFIDMSDYQEPEAGTIFQVGERLYEFIEITDTHKSKGSWGDTPVPEWYRLRCKVITGTKMKWAGEEHRDKVLINLTDSDLEEAA